MHSSTRRAALLMIGSLVPLLAGAQEPGAAGRPAPVAADEALAWPAVTATAKPWAYNWWLGSAVDPGNLTKELTRYRDAGLGGIHIIPIYGAKGYEARYVDYLSPRWMEMLRHTVAEARRLGMDVDMTLGTGWCFGGPNVPPEQGTRRVVTAKPVDAPAGKPFATKVDRKALLAVFARAADGTLTDLTSRIGDDGTLTWTPDKPCKVHVVTTSAGRQGVKRSAPGGVGPMLNPFELAAIRHYTQRFTDAFAKYEGPKPRAVYHDSYEYQNDWSPGLLDEFKKRRGYDLRPHLPKLFSGDADEAVARLKCDLRETVSDLMVEHFNPTWMGWAHERGMLARDQAHGSPANLLDLYASADVPETELFRTDRDVLMTKFASSAAHVAGRKLVSSETGTWLAEHFNETLGELKTLVDELFVGGVNHVFYHGCCYSPDDAPWPGWLFYAATQMNPRSAVWRDAPALNAYIARCQSVLQGGKPDNDILLYWPVHDLWHDSKGLTMGLTVHNAHEWLAKQPFGATARKLWERGYTFDYVSDRQLAAIKVEDGVIRTPAGGMYRAIVVPPCKVMPAATQAKLLELIRSNAKVVFEDAPPAGEPGLLHADNQASLRGYEFDDQPDGLRRAKIFTGTEFFAGSVEAALRRFGVEREEMADTSGLLFIRRATDGGRDYFVANHGTAAVEKWVSLSAMYESVGLMDPMDGRTGVVATYRNADGRGRVWTQVFLQLPPGRSVILRAFSKQALNGPAWKYWEKAAPEPTTLSGKWAVNFVDGGPEKPEPFETDQLTSWAAHGPKAEAFAGTARYTLTFDLPEAMARWPDFVLDLGAVRESARVKLNGQDLGCVFAPPMRVSVGALKPAGNVLEVEVTNTSANRIRDLDRRGVKWKVFNDINIVNIDYKPFDASKWPLRDAGLLGPVTLTPVNPLRPNPQ